VWFQNNLRHIDSQLANRGWRIALVHQLPLREHLANVGKAIIFVGIFGFGDMHEVEQARIASAIRNAWANASALVSEKSVGCTIVCIPCDIMSP
jgi:hypothetical protein